jgi:hypothetical protein
MHNGWAMVPYRLEHPANQIALFVSVYWGLRKPEHRMIHFVLACCTQDRANGPIEGFTSPKMYWLTASGHTRFHSHPLLLSNKLLRN